MTDNTRAAYEQIPYESHPHTATHPDNLASLAALFGLSPPPLENCRVLELGCSTAGNIVAIADSLPGSRCVGVDLAPNQIATGEALRRGIGAANVELRAASILDVDASWGMFDYIICHGVYSWVLPAVRDHILKVCSQNLTPHGIAYVSYNVYPGWRLGEMLRDMVEYHSRRYTDASERIDQVQEFLNFVTDLVGQDPDNTLYHHILAHEVNLLAESSRAYLFHEFLEEVNQPVYFHEFAASAAAAGLQFVSEAQLSMMIGNLPGAAKRKLHGWANDIIEYEQYLDFVRNRRFRMSLFCHAGRAVNWTPGPEVTPRFRYAAFALPIGAPSPDGSGTEQFKTPTGMTLSTNSPWMRATMRALTAIFPRSASYAELAECIRAHLPAEIDFAEASFQQGLFQCALSRLVEIQLHEPAFVSEASERPIASPLARLQAPHGRRVTNRRHRNIELEPQDLSLLPALDGTRDRQALVELLAARIVGGAPFQDETGETVTDPSRIRDLLGPAVDSALRRFARSALLVG